MKPIKLSELIEKSLTLSKSAYVAYLGEFAKELKLDGQPAIAEKVLEIRDKNVFTDIAAPHNLRLREKKITLWFLNSAQDGINWAIFDREELVKHCLEQYLKLGIPRSAFEVVKKTFIEVEGDKIVN